MRRLERPTRVQRRILRQPRSSPMLRDLRESLPSSWVRIVDGDVSGFVLETRDQRKMSAKISHAARAAAQSTVNHHARPSVPLIVSATTKKKHPEQQQTNGRQFTSKLSWILSAVPRVRQFTLANYQFVSLHYVTNLYKRKKHVNRNYHIASLII